MSPAKKSGSEKIRSALLAGEALEAADIKRFGVTSGVLTIIVSELRGRGAEFEMTDVPSDNPRGGSRKRYKLLTPPNQLDMTIRPAEAVRRGRGQVKDKKATHLAKVQPRSGGAHTGASQGMYDALRAGEVLSPTAETRSAIYYAAQRLEKEGIKVVRERDATDQRRWLWHIANRHSPKLKASKPEAVEIVTPAPPSLDVPAWGSLVKITGLIEGEDGELHIILRQNGHAWHCVVAGKAETT